MDKIDGKKPDNLMQKIVGIKCKIQALVESLGIEISFEDYSTLLKINHEHDIKLTKYFKETGEKDKLILVQERTSLFFQEMTDLQKVRIYNKLLK